MTTTGTRDRTGERTDRRGLLARNSKESQMTSFRKDFGNIAMTDAQYSNAKSVFANVDKKVSDSVSEAKSKIPAYRDVEMVAVHAGGDGDPGYTYHLPKDSAASILQKLVAASNDTYHYVQHENGSYGIAFGEYGKEGYEALNSVQEQIDAARASQKKQYEGQIDTFNETVDMTRAGVSRMKQEAISKWQSNIRKATENNTALVNRLVSSGILTRRAKIS